MARKPTSRSSEPSNSDNSEKRYAFRIGTRSAQHRSKRNGTWRTFGYGDTIDLTMKQFQSGNYNNLNLQGPLVGGQVAEPDLSDADVLNDEPNPPVRSKTRDASRTPDGTEVQDIGDDDGDGVGGDGEPDEDQGDGDEAPTVSKRKVSSLIKGLEESSGSSEFNAARQKVIDADIFEEGTVPTKKADLIEALNEYRDEL